MIQYRSHIRMAIIFLMGWYWACPAQAQGEAIALLGGEMSYECVRKRYNGSAFEITLKLRRNCFKDTEFDTTAKVMIFPGSPDVICQSNAAAWVKLKLKHKERRSIDNESCGNLCGALCVEEATYRQEVILPSCPGGYMLAYQQCCRDEAIDNILDPGLFAGIWWVHITQEAADSCNSSPKLPGWIHGPVCVNNTYNWDFSAQELDGDSLAYRLYTPHIGEEQESSYSKTVKPPPYDTVQFVPPYSRDDFIGGELPLKIDPVTGIISATPGTIGQFLIGVAVDEWRNGQWIGTIRSDFQIEVCGPDTCLAPRDSVFLCSGETVQLLDALVEFSPSEGCKYAWEPKEGLMFDPADTQQKNPTLVVLETTRFTVIASNGEFADTGYVYLQVDPGPELVLPDTVFLRCVNADCASVKVDTSYDYQWDPMPQMSLEGDSLRFTFCDIPVDGYYRVTVSSPRFSGIIDDQGICTLKDSIYVTAKPVVKLFPDTICVGDTSAFLLQDRIDCWTYDWEPDESLIFLDSLVRALPSTTTAYRVTVTNGSAVEVDSVTVTVLTKDTLSIEVLGPPFLCGGVATLVAHSSGITSGSFLWSYTPDFAIVESREDTFQVVTDLDTLTVYLTATGTGTVPFCGAETTSIQLVNKTLNLQVSYAPIDTCLTDTTWVLILNQLTGLPAASILWSTADVTNWVDPDNLTANPILVRINRGQSKIVLHYETTCQTCCPVQDSVVVEVSGSWKLNIDTMQNFCGDTITYTVNDSSKRNNASFTWYNGIPGGPGSDIIGSGESLVEQGDVSPSVFVTGEAFWCRDTATVENISRPKLSSVTASPASLCVGDTAYVMLSPLPGDSLSTTWETNGRIVDSTETFLKVVALSGMDSLEISYASKSLTCPNITCDSLLIFLLDTIVSPKPLWVKIPCTYQAVVSVDTLVYQEGDVMWISIGTGETSMATIDTLTFPGSGSYQVILLPGPKLQSCLFDPDTLTIVIPEFIQLIPDQDTIVELCATPQTPEDSIFQLSVTPTLDIISIIWIDADHDTLGMGTTLLVNPYEGLDSVYAISAKDACDCRDTVKFCFLISNCELLITGLEGEYCADKDFTGPSASLICDTSVDVVYEWQESDFIVSGQDSPSPVFNAPVSFEVTVKILDTSRNCEYDTSFFINIFEKPSVSIEVDPDKVLVGLPTTLTALPNSGEPFAYAWSTGESTQAITVVAPEEGASYQVTITDVHGCCDTSSVRIKPLPCRVGVPTAFSPNGDGQNDIFTVRSSCPLADFELKIINRWGQCVFLSTEQSDGWDGTMKSLKLPPDVYAYCLFYRCANEDEKEILFGDVTLFR